MSTYLTKRICAEMLPYMREHSNIASTCRGEHSGSDYDALRKLAKAVDAGRETARGGAVLDVTLWPRRQVETVRDVLRATLAGCTQMQVRKALLRRIDQLDDYIGTSAVERLARLS